MNQTQLAPAKIPKFWQFVRHCHGFLKIGLKAILTSQVLKIKFEILSWNSKIYKFLSAANFQPLQWKKSDPEWSTHGTCYCTHISPLSALSEVHMAHAAALISAHPGLWGFPILAANFGCNQLRDNFQAFACHFLKWLCSSIEIWAMNP